MSQFDNWHPFWPSGSLSKGSHVLVQGSKVSSGTFSMFLFEILWLLFVRIPFGGWNVLKNPKICARTQNDCWLIYIWADFIETLTKWPTHVTDILAKSHQNLRKISKKMKNSSFRSIFTWFWSIFFFKFIRKTWANQFPGCKSSLGSLRGDKTRKTIKNQRFLINFCSFFPFCRPGVSSKYSYAPESVCPRFSDEFKKKWTNIMYKLKIFQ